MTPRTSDYKDECPQCSHSDRPWAEPHHAWDCYWADPFNSDGYDDMTTAITDTHHDEHTGSQALAVTSAGSSDGGAFWSTGAVSYRTCTHALDSYSLSDGTVIYLSASSDKFARTYEPDMAVYLASSWFPKCVAFHVGWVDYGLPALSDDDLLRVARTALDAARAGQVVEIGCMGAHGRTGTFVAVLELLAMADHSQWKQAIALVRTQHCHKAIETDEQEWFVRHIAGVLTNTYVAPYVRARAVHSGSTVISYNGAKGKRKKYRK